MIAYNIQNNDGGSHKRKDRPEGGMYVNETDTALTVGSTDITAVTSWTIRGRKPGGGKGYLENENQAMTLGGQPQWLGVRRLTPTECERLQGFPDGWTAGQSDSQRYRQLGNAVTVNVIKWIGNRIIEYGG
jgi:site-specific DNA-cytosine methylase